MFSLNEKRGRTGGGGKMGRRILGKRGGEETGGQGEGERGRGEVRSPG
jgi:hypothetical protein